MMIAKPFRDSKKIDGLRFEDLLSPPRSVSQNFVIQDHGYPKMQQQQQQQQYLLTHTLNTSQVN